MPVADNWMAKRIKPCDVFIGWQHLGLKTVSAAKKMGAKTVLEHPTIAATKWNDLVLEEYKLWKGITRGTNSIYSKR
ncbi:hypothetical protein OFM21_29175, partial [Escherichia coli]|nr:hypothetical protein [Escherichia coli]